jgi:hypothetical protein
VKSLNEQLAELCGLELHPEPNCEKSSFQFVYHEDRDIYEPWNPTQDLNQLRMCYEALIEDEDAMNRFYCHFQDIYSKTFGAYPNSMTFFTAIFKHPELVAQAILKAKGVS